MSRYLSRYTTGVSRVTSHDLHPTPLNTCSPSMCAYLTGSREAMDGSKFGGER